MILIIMSIKEALSQEKLSSKTERPSACLAVKLCLTLKIPRMTVARQAPLSMECSRKKTGMRSHSLLQGIFPSQGLSPGLLRLLRWEVGSLPLSHLEA